jgi:hypothetical protein
VVARHLRRNHGRDSFPPDVIRERIHAIKEANGLKGDHDLTFGLTGDVWDSIGGDWLSTLTDKGATSMNANRRKPSTVAIYVIVRLAEEVASAVSPVALNAAVSATKAYRSYDVALREAERLNTLRGGDYKYMVTRARLSSDLESSEL